MANWNEDKREEKIKKAYDIGRALYNATGHWEDSFVPIIKKAYDPKWVEPKDWQKIAELDFNGFLDYLRNLKINNKDNVININEYINMACRQHSQDFAQLCALLKAMCGHLSSIRSAIECLAEIGDNDD